MQVGTAQAVYQQLVPRLDDDVANLADRAPDLRNIATRPALETIFAELACGCLQLPRLPAPSIEFSVPIERSYPLSFLAEADETLYEKSSGEKFPYVFLTIFEKMTPQSSWEIAYYAASTTPHLIEPPGADVTGAGATSSPEVAYLRSLTAALTSARLHGDIPAANPWSVAPQNTVLGTLFHELEEDHLAESRERLDVERPYRLISFSPTFKVSDGTIKCGTIVGSTTYVGGVGAPLVQPDNRSEWGDLLAPGDYSSITFNTAREACVVVQRDDFFLLHSIYGGVWSITGDRLAAQ